MKSAAVENNGDAFAGHWEHENGIIIMHIDPNLPYPMMVIQPNRRQNFLQKIGEQVATFCNQAKRLWIRQTHTDRDRLPHLFLSVHENELKGQSIPETLLTVEVIRADGQIARASLSIGHNDLHGFYATLNCPKRQTDVQQTAKMTFVDWDKPLPE